MGDFIKKVWDNSAVKHKKSHWASWGDNFAISLEIQEIEKCITNNMKILDVGCSNGYAVFSHAKKNNSISIHGVDFSEKMIEFAQERLFEEKLENVSFSVEDVRKMNMPDESFDMVYTTRVIINLPTWEEQIQGILECIRVTKKGGIIILSEAFWEPLNKLNALRQLFGLQPLVEHDFNRYIKKNKLELLLGELKLNYKTVDFSSIYYLGSRVLRELVTDYQKYEGYSNPINEVFYNIENEYSGGDIGIQQIYIIYK